MLFQGLDVEGFFFQETKLDFPWTCTIICAHHHHNLKCECFYVFPTSEKLWEYFAKQKKTCIFCEITVWLIWRTLRNYILPRIVMKKKNNCVSPKTFQNMTLWNKEKKKQFDEKKIIFMSLDGIEFLLLWRTVSSADWWKLSPLGNYTHENPKMKVSIIKQATHSLEIEDFLCEINFGRKYPKKLPF